MKPLKEAIYAKLLSLVNDDEDKVFYGEPDPNSPGPYYVYWIPSEIPGGMAGFNDDARDEQFAVQAISRDDDVAEDMRWSAFEAFHDKTLAVAGWRNEGLTLWDAAIPDIGTRVGDEVIWYYEGDLYRLSLVRDRVTA